MTAAIVLASQAYLGRSFGIAICVFLAFFAAAFTLYWTPVAALDLRGQPVMAVVATKHAIRANSYEYTLRGMDGQPIDGVLNEFDDAYAPGDHIQIVTDPYRVLEPTPFSEVDGERRLWFVSVALVLVTALSSTVVGSRGGMERIDLRFRGRYKRRH